MKKAIIYSAIVLAGLCTTACSGFLDEEPKLSQTNELTLSKFSSLDDATAALYTRFQSYYWYGAAYVLDGELSSGNARNPITYPGSGRYRTQADWAYNESSTWSIWYYSYYTISAANNVINNLEGKTSSTVTQKQIDNIKAEALAVRALCYFDLVNVFAQPYTYNKEALGVPVVLVTEMGSPARNKVSEVYDQIVKDLVEAEKLMSDDYSREGVIDKAAAFNKLSIQALLSRVYLYMGEWQKAADYATTVIESNKYSLQTGDKYLDMFTANVATEKDEIIFEVYSSIKNSYWDGSGWEQMSYVTTLDDSNGSADVCASEDLIKTFEATDQRLALYELKNNTDWECKKYAGKEGSGVPKENNTIVIRLSEMYLNRAEAIINGATISGVTASGDLSALAAARGTSQAAPSKTGVLEERRRELAFEGHYFFDLKRTGTGVVRTDNRGINVPFPDNKWAMPIPKAECEANPNMEQNPF